MKVTIIDITSISQALPKYRTWYKYYDDILISVIFVGGVHKSHLRKKSKIKGEVSKRDNEMCF